MKKFLLLSAAALGMMSMSAEETDLTPKNYKFYETTANSIEELGILSDYFDTNWNLPGYFWEDYVAERYNEGYLTYAGGGNLEQCQSQISLVDFGGEVGKVLAIASGDCDINAVLAEKYGENAPTVKVPAGGTAQHEFFFYFDNDPEKYPNKNEDKYMHIRVQANVYSHAPAVGKTVGGNMYINDNANNVRPDGDNATAGNALSTVETVMEIEGEDDNGDPTLVQVWDPTKWVNIEWNFVCPAADDHSYGPKLKWNIAANWNGQPEGFCIFVRQIELKAIDGELVELKPHQRTIETLEPNPGQNGIASVVDDNNAPKVYYNLQGVRVENPTTGLYIVKQGNSAKKVLVK